MKAASKKKTNDNITDRTPEERKKALDTAIAQIEKDFGKGSIIRMGENSRMNVSAVPTGSIALDLALGIGGLPKGRIIEIYGPESSGKTTLALSVVAQVQKQDGQAAFIDAEHALDPVYAKALGVDIENMLVSQPDSGEQALEICDALVRSGAVDIIVIDSVAALVPQQEIDGDMGASHVGLQARLMSQALRKLSGTIAKTNCIVIFINQLREKVGVMYGNPETTTGGRALKFYASVRIDIRKSEALKKGTEVYGNRVKCKIVKNKVAPPFTVAEFDILYGQGISKSSEILDMGVTLGILEKSGAWFYYDGNRIGQGKENARQFLESDPALMAEIEAKIKEKGAAVEAERAEEAEDDEDDEELDIRLLDMDDTDEDDDGAPGDDEE
ncbi:MAG: recombinase RecA [Eubacteriales bacterium]|nr:recombinase RecA [Clostridiales bacterium]MDD7774782.1 recombinase RecA [Eubacteriales bacterium]MDY3941054.1 recombinase RecA [Eubacteriales bacterium]